MPIFEAPAVYAWGSYITICTYLMEHLYLKEYLDFHTSSASVIPLTTPNGLYYFRREKADKERVVNIFGANGDKLYTIERKTPLNPVWTMLTYPSRREVATIRCGFFSRSIDFHNKPGLQHRLITNESSLTTGKIRSFYLNDGAKYAWTRGTKFLEKITNPSGGDEEVHERLAKVRLMRQWKFDFEMIIDETKMDREVAFGTAFISMLTQWGFGDITETRGPTFVPGVTLGSTQDAAAAAAAAGVAAKIKKEEEKEEEQERGEVTIVINGVSNPQIVVE